MNFFYLEHLVIRVSGIAVKALGVLVMPFSYCASSAAKSFRNRFGG